MTVGKGKRRARIALFTISFRGDRTQRALLSLARRKFDLVVYAERIPPELTELVEWQRIPAAQLTRPRVAWGSYYIVGGLRRLGLRADLVHTWSPFPLIPGRIDLATITFCHAAYHEATGGEVVAGNPMLWRAARQVSVGLERRRYANSGVRMLAAISKEERADLERHFPGVPVALTPRGVDTDRFRPDPESRRETRSELGISDDDVVAVHVATPNPLKGLPILLEAMALLQRRGREAPLLLVAGHQPDRALSLAEELGISTRIRVLGLRPDIERIYRAADMLVLPTLYEAFCRVAHEAAASALPVVAPPGVNGIQGLVGNNEAGLLPARDADAVAGAIERLTADPDLRTRLGEEGRRRTLDQPPELFAERTVECYERLLADPGG